MGHRRLGEPCLPGRDALCKLILGILGSWSFMSSSANSAHPPSLSMVLYGWEGKKTECMTRGSGAQTGTTLQAGPMLGFRQTQRRRKQHHVSHYLRWCSPAVSRTLLETLQPHFPFCLRARFTEPVMKMLASFLFQGIGFLPGEDGLVKTPVGWSFLWYMFARLG